MALLLSRTLARPPVAPPCSRAQRSPTCGGPLARVRGASLPTLWRIPCSRAQRKLAHLWRRALLARPPCSRPRRLHAHLWRPPAAARPRVAHSVACAELPSETRM